MSENRISISFLSSAQVQDALRRDATPRMPLRARVTARLFAGRFDRMLAVGVPAPAGSALAVHAARLSSVDEREAIARSLRRAVADARNRDAIMSSRMRAERSQHRRGGGSDRPGHPAAALAPTGDSREGSRDFGCCSPTGPGRCTATAVATSRVGSARRSPRSDRFGYTRSTAAPEMRPAARSVRASSARPSGYSGVVTSMRWRPAKARNSRASSRVLDVTERTWRSKNR